MAFVSLPYVNQGKHHENERLQQHNQDVENSPQRPGQNVAEPKTNVGQAEAGPGTAKQRDQHENEFAGKHVAKQPHSKRNRFGRVFYQVQQQVERRENKTGNTGRRERAENNF